MGTWQSLGSQPTFNASTMFLLTDGRVMAQEEYTRNWWALRPDPQGNYLNGSWSALAPSKNFRRFYASAVLADGRLLVAGGEYSDAGGNLDAAEIYDPFLDSWSSISTPGWGWIGDGSSCLLTDGRFLLGSINDTRTAIYDPVADTWTAAAAKSTRCDEETWSLLPDGSVLAVETNNSPQAEKYLPWSDQWVSAGSTPVQLVQTQSSEIGPALLLPDGRLFCIGATGHTALYTPPANPALAGSWTAGPDIPVDGMGRLQKAKDAPGVLLPNGKVLFIAGPAADDGSDWPAPVNFFEFSPATNTITATGNPTTINNATYESRLLLLPTGQVLHFSGAPWKAGATVDTASVYTPDGGPVEAWEPKLQNVPNHLITANTYTISGWRLNGWSQAVSYGDDDAQATNYPLVRLTDASGNVTYCPTFDHSSMGVNTGGAVVTTRFYVPIGLGSGTYDLCVIANGISSDCVAVKLSGFVKPQIPHEELWAWLIGSLADGPLWELWPHPGPVDPFTGEMAERARQAQEQIKAGLLELSTLRAEIVQLRSTTATQTFDSPIKAITKKEMAVHGV